MNDGVLVVDFNGRILFVNRAAAELLHIGESEITEIQLAVNDIVQKKNIEEKHQAGGTSFWLKFRRLGNQCP